MKRRGFTLIELLVVIAIIAILAAILFPVFAQAKAAAKRSASLSNAKQITLGAIMYSSDNDDLFVLMQNGPTTGFSATVGNTDLRTKSWQELVQPYVKSAALMADPVRGDTLGVWAGPATTTGLTSYRNQNRFPMFGYNYIFLSPFDFCVDADGISTTATVEPAATVMFTQSRAFTTNDLQGYYVVNAPGMWPQIAPHSTYCIYWDGTVGSGNWSGGNTTLPKKTSSSGYLDSAFGMNASWVDGHTRYMSDGAITKGTNYASATRTNADEGASVTNRETYLWNLNDNYYDE
jgi:prepilin-type N-terminal cleavage/methylation domain-containing protein